MYMSSRLFSSLEPKVREMLASTSRNQLFIGSIVIALGIPLVRYFHQDYRRWYDLGQGGAPRNIVGYTLVKILTQLGNSDTDSTVVYVHEGETSELEHKSFLDTTIPNRAGPRPHISKWAAPVRQLSAMSPTDVKKKLQETLLKHANGISVENRKSSIEGGTHPANALHIVHEHADPKRRFATRGPSEFYHVHPSDGSAHAIVSAADAKILIEAGWSERHPLSGARVGGFPATYIMVYAPRTEEEIAVHQAVAQAAAKYATKKSLE